MKIIVIFLLLTTATSYMYSGIKIVHRNTKLFLSDNEKDFYEKLLQSKDEVLKSKDGELKSKDEALKSNEVFYHKLLQSKDEVLKLKDEILSRTNAEILDLQGRLSFRSVFEEFEQRCGTRFVSDSSLAKGITQREKIWNWIIENNCSGINQYLGENSTDWPSVAKSLYKLVSDDIHKYKSKKVVINNTSMSTEMTVLAEAVCRVFPIKYDIIAPSLLDLQS